MKPARVTPIDDEWEWVDVGDADDVEPLLRIADELAEAVEQALEDPTLATTVRVIHALFAWRERVPARKVGR